MEKSMNPGNNAVSINRYILLVLLIAQGLSGVVGGIFFIIDPSGNLINIPIEWLNGSPFNNYLIPGIILFIILGLFPLFVMLQVWKRSIWSKYTPLSIGIALIIWIIAEIIIIGYQSEPPLQLVYGILGVLILVSAFIHLWERFNLNK
jgi:uncharacterized BrkB/YihY/UPF0761 family membrane protein